MSAYRAMASVKARCNPADHARLRPQRSCSKNISPLCIAIQRLRDDTHVGNARLLDCVHDRGKSPERYIFVGTQENRLVLGIANSLPQFGGNFIDIDGVVAEKNALFLVDADD